MKPETKKKNVHRGSAVKLDEYDKALIRERKKETKNAQSISIATAIVLGKARKFITNLELSQRINTCDDIADLRDALTKLDQLRGKR